MNQLTELKQKILQLINFHHECYRNVKLELNDDHIAIKYQTMETIGGVETLKDHSGLIAFNSELGEGELVFYEKLKTPKSGSPVLKKDLLRLSVEG